MKIKQRKKLRLKDLNNKKTLKKYFKITHLKLNNFSHLFLYNLFADRLFQIIPNKFIVYSIFLCLFFLIGFIIESFKRKWGLYNKSEFVKIILGK